MHRVRVVITVSLALAACGLAAKGKNVAPKASPSVATKPAPAVDHLGPIASRFATSSALTASQLKELVGAVEGLTDCGACIFVTEKVQNRTNRYLAVVLQQDYSSGEKTRRASWLLVFDEKGIRKEVKLIDAREVNGEQLSGTKSAFLAKDRFELRSWSTYDHNRKDPTLSEGTPECLRIADDGKLVEDVVPR
jgi:hypothetical protein